MENRQRKRGISLVRHQRSNSDLDQSFIAPIDQSQPSVTRLHYSRYPTSHTIRQVSAPKPNVSFCYGVGHQTPPLHPQQIRSFRRENTEAFRQSQLMKELNRSEAKDIETSYADAFSSANQKYESFQHCKEVIGKRLFGDSRASSNQTTNKRHNYLQQYLHPQINTIPQPFQIDCKDEIPSEPTIRVVRTPLQTYAQSNLLRPKDEKPEPTLRASNKTLTIENTENIIITPTQAEPSKPKKGKREPMNLNEMERRLREIIKICDQNI